MMLNSFVTTVATPAKMAGAQFADQHLGQVCGFNNGLGGGVINLCHVGDEHGIDASVAQHLQIAGLVARVGGQVFGRAELRGVHENRHRNLAAFGPRTAHQRHVAVVQKAHGRNQRDMARSLAPSPDRGLLSGKFPSSPPGVCLCLLRRAAPAAKLRHSVKTEQ